MPEDVEQYKAGSRSRFDTPEFYAVFASFLRTLRLFQSTKAAISREGFQKNIHFVGQHCRSSPARIGTANERGIGYGWQCEGQT